MKENELSRRTAVGLAAGAALTVATGERWVFAAREGDVVKTPGDATAWRPVLFDRTGGEALARVVDTLIPRTSTPGARDARVHEYIDLAVSLEPPEEKKAFVDGSGGSRCAARRLTAPSCARRVGRPGGAPPLDQRRAEGRRRRSRAGRVLPRPQATHHLRLLHLARRASAGARACPTPSRCRPGAIPPPDGEAHYVENLPARRRAALHRIPRVRFVVCGFATS